MNRWSFFVFAVLFVACAQQPKVADEPRFEGLGAHERKVTTNDADAQSFFNQGIAFLFAFNHDEAIRSFEQAAKFDSSCAMAWWGIAYAHGPHINFPLMLPDKVDAAWVALQMALKHKHHASDVEKDLIDALSKRYANPQPENRAPLDSAYANAMRVVWSKHKNDADVGALFAESMMDLRPWDQWQYDGAPQPGTEEVLSTLETVINMSPKHPMANHLYIHACEASQHPDRADQAASVLRDLQPGLGHNVHMPSHIDVRTGRWEEAIVANEKAIKADGEYRKLAKVAPGFYNVYMAHNHHMMGFAGMMSGRSAQAIAAVDEYVADIPDSFKINWAPIVDGYMAGPFEVRMRFGKWEEILALELPKDIHPIARTLAFHARAVSYAALGKMKEAEAEQKKFEESAAKIPPGSMFGNNQAADLILVARDHLAGELLIRKGQAGKGIKHLSDAVAAEDRLRYDEPPDWIVPIRHSLGAALVNNNQLPEAEAVYNEDLRRLPKNGWSLFGLSKVFELQGKKAEADQLKKQFKEVWAKADMEISSSCMCFPFAK